ncbi:MAG: hypothetical protein PQ612_08915 [Rickettsiales bacterium]|nr:hypothetical protein [Pseudomonadota bacterium]MDA0967308.1 hypothetical protein [Pseudomonadota bacterium]MDG4544031.1 hypothetical protein [Rickettsiales bacterium]MDG4546275.1 hypothetical protein [Rickettsiales bacterium]MDG4548355.1 hypothetical protein [Rickettsiales bacterium]
MNCKKSLLCAFSLLCIIFLSGCESLRQNFEKQEPPKISVVKKPDIHEVVIDKKNENPEKENIFQSLFLEHLHLARLNLAAFNREKALKFLNNAFEEVKDKEAVNPDESVLVKVEFAKKGFASTPSYLILAEKQNEQIQKIIANLQEGKQELSSISLMQPTSHIVSSKIIGRLEDGVKALRDADAEAPDYDFAVADRAIRDVYADWKIVPYQSDSVFETKYYLNTAKLLLESGYIDIAEDLLDSADKSYSRSYGRNVFNSDNYEFVSYYKQTSNNLKQIINRDKNIQNRVSRKVKGVMDYLF